MPEEPQTLWGPSCGVSKNVREPGIIFGHMPQIYDLTINNKIFLEANMVPIPGVEFTIEDHPIFKGTTFRIISTEQHHKLGYTLVRVVIVKEQSLG